MFLFRGICRRRSRICSDTEGGSEGEGKGEYVEKAAHDPTFGYARATGLALAPTDFWAL
jgi:hypothetical protein